MLSREGQSNTIFCQNACLVLEGFEPSFRLTRIRVRLSTGWSAFGHLTSKPRIPLRLDDVCSAVSRTDQGEKK